MTAAVQGGTRISPVSVLAHPHESFADASRRPSTRSLLALHLGSYLVLMLALTPGFSATVAEVMGPERPTEVAVAVTALLVGMALLMCAAATVLGAFVLHVVARALGGRGSARASCDSYLLASVPIWIRNIALAVAFLVLDDVVMQEHLGAIRLVDPFVLTSAGLAAIALRHVHKLSWPGCAVGAGVAIGGGQLLASGVLG